MQASSRTWAAAWAVAALLSGCASAVRTEPAQFTPVAASSPVEIVTLANDTTITPASGYGRTLKAGSRWRLAGRVGQGQVFRPVDSVFTIEGRQVHEAYLVMSGARLVGFYLPGEANYAALEVPVPLTLGDSR